MCTVAELSAGACLKIAPVKGVQRLQVCHFPSPASLIEPDLLLPVKRLRACIV